MESIIVACVTGAVTLVGVIFSNSKSRAIMEVKLDALTAKAGQLCSAAHNSSTKILSSSNANTPEYKSGGESASSSAPS